MPQKEEYISLDEAAKKLGVSRPTIYKMIARGILRKFKKIGDKKTYIPVGDIEDSPEFERRE